MNEESNSIQRRQRRSNEEILNLVREAKRLVESGRTITSACEQVDIKYRTYINNQSRVRTNKHLYGNKFAQAVEQQRNEYSGLKNAYDNQKEITNLKKENVRLKSIIADLLLKQTEV